jgi:hypothetical protein
LFVSKIARALSAVGGMRPVLEHGFAMPEFIFSLVFFVPAAEGGRHEKNEIVAVSIYPT